MKSVIEKNFYKLSSFNAHDGFYGHESVNELIVSRLLDILQIPHTNYRLVHALVEVDEQEYTTWLCVSKDYRKLGETYWYDAKRISRCRAKNKNQSS